MTDDRRYGYFAIERVQGGILQLPDGQKRLFEKYDDAVEARSDWVAENVLPEAQKKVVEDRRAFIDGCSVQEERVKQQGLLTPDIIVRKVVDGDGAYVGNPSAKDFDEIVEEAALERFPGPAVPADPTVTGSVEKVVVWAAKLHLDNKPKALPAFTRWSFGLPIESVLEVLNQLATEGWTVVHVSEDRGLYSGTTNRTDSAINRARYLLARNG